ncbi:MAG: methionyl-tRNA formyltransferase, partial [Myxococcota bacterium]|nr:methionyl-tRNA formyltransferase [Myxococcota bacterium]
MNPLRVVFIGSSQWGLKALRVLTDLEDIQVVGAVTNPAVFKISYRPSGVKNVHHADVAGFCADVGIPVYTMAADESMKSPGLLAQLEVWQPDYFFALGWYHVIPKAIRNLAPVLGIHYSRLPDYAGGAPLVWALINRETVVGATFFQLDGGIDTGPIIGVAEVDVKPRETIGALYERVGQASLALLSRAFPRFARGEIRAVPQTGEGRRVYPQRGPEDGLIDWTQSAIDIDAFIRAQTRPYPGAFFHDRERKITVWSAVPSSPPSALNPGEWRVHGASVFIGCGHDALMLQDVECDGRGF